ncbi:hypothetical protein E5358_12770 [Palleniella muris]|uniref:Uncharacterized protein n=1 Tax=Palleniella muris TaxID=3038145 RepID=A0AC61QMC6_9BACT|nr:hypothetical protein [Palleniella muris]TGX80523.1 hypothetical protein E5358_12770 [Palleniella muris]
MDRTAIFIAQNFKTIVSCIGVVLAFYIQYQINMVRVTQLENELVKMHAQLDSQYQKLDAIKLDKSVFEATTKQWASMSQDIREIRTTLEGILQSEHDK